ncbi:PKD domain-containing protein, partial [Eubacterium sp.]|uniref:PKD domain-containing protein n=1 Tax=Eubacterium sp. TaxID=142586 RepID=UPI0025E6B888
MRNKKGRIVKMNKYVKKALKRAISLTLVASLISTNIDVAAASEKTEGLVSFNGKYYDTFEEAVTEANDSALTSVTICLYGDVEVSESIKLKNKEYIIKGVEIALDEDGEGGHTKIKYNITNEDEKKDYPIFEMDGSKVEFDSVSICGKGLDKNNKMYGDVIEANESYIHLYNSTIMDFNSNKSIINMKDSSINMDKISGISGNAFDGYGCIHGEGTSRIKDGSIDNNNGGKAGGIYAEGPLYVEDTNIFGNKGSDAGGIYAKDSLYTKGVTVYKNSYSGYASGGGITINSKFNSELINTRIANNKSYTDYGGLRLLGSGNVDLYGVTFADNEGKFSVGAVRVDNKDATLTFKNKGRYDSVFGKVDCARNEIGHQSDTETIRNYGTIICDDVYIHNDREKDVGLINIKDNGNFVLGSNAEINDTIVLEKENSSLKIKGDLQYHSEVNPIVVKYDKNLDMSLPKTVAYIEGTNKEELGYDILSKKLLFVDEERIPDSAYLEYKDGKIELSSDVKKIKIKAKNKKGEAVKGVSFELYLVKSIEYDDNGEVKSCKSTKVKRTESTDDNGEVLLSGFGAGKYRLVTVSAPSEYSSADTKDLYFDLVDDDKNIDVIVANRDYSPTAVIRGFVNDDNEDSADEDDEDEESQNTSTGTQDENQQEGEVLDSKNGKESKINENICFNAGDSSDDEGIVSYTWDFGDGSERVSGKVVNHRYEKAGTYTVNLIITDSKGQKSVASTKFKVSGFRSGESGVDLYIYDSQTLGGVKDLNVYIYDENGNQVYAKAQKTDVNGKLNIALKPGKYSLKASNSMYPIRMKSFIVSGNTDISMPINSVTAAESKIELHDLTYDEMVEAGIDVNNIGNVSFAGFKIELDFDTEYEYDSDKNNRKREDLEYIIYYSHSEQKWVVNGKRAKEIEAVELDPDHVLVYDSGFKWEKEIFEVKLLTINNSKTDTIKNAYAKIDFNDKVTYAAMDEESESQNFDVKKVDDVKPGEVGVTSWYLRGENEGEAEIGVETYGDFCSSGNEPQPFSCYAHTNKDIHIVNVKDFKFEVKCDKYAYSDEEYKVELRVRNQSGRKLSNFTLYNASRMQVSADYLTELEKGDDDVFVRSLSSYGSVSLTFRTKFKSAYSEEQLKYELLRLVFTIYDGFSSDIPADVEISKSDVVSACDYAGIDYDSMPKPKAADPVDLLTGSFTYDYKDLELSGKESLTYERYYNSNDNLNEKFVFDENDDTKTIKNHLSEGWSDNYSYAIEKMYVDENKEELELIDFSEKADDENTSDQNNDKEELSSESATKGEMICMTLPKGERVYFSAPKNSEEDKANESESTYENDDIKYVQYISRKGSNFTLYETENKYVVISNFGKTYVFNHKGQIECIKKSNENIIDELKVAESEENTYNVFNDNEVVFTYDDCYLKKVKSVAGELKFNYDLAGKIIDVSSNDNYIVRLSYDKGNLKKITDADGGITEYQYYDNNLLKSIKSPDKIKLFENTYDDYGRVTKQVVDEKETYLFTYENKFDDVNTSANMTNTVTGPNGYIKKIVTDNDGRTVSETENGKETSYTYNDNNLLFTKTDADGNVTKYYYDDNGHNSKIKYADGLFEKFEYDAKGRLLSKTGKSKVTEYYNYDKYGNLTSYTNGVGEVALYEYDKNGNLILMTDYMGTQSKFSYDKKGNVLSYVDAQNNTISFTYDDRGLIESKKNPDGNSEEYEYSKAGKLLSVTDYSGSKETYDLSDAGVKLGITDKRGNKTSIFYDERDRKNGVKTAEGRETKYAYDSANNIEKITDALGYSLNYEYDSDGNVTKYTDNAGNEYVYSYNNDGSVKSYIDPLNNKYNYFYDTNGNLKKSENPDGSSEKYDYDALGNVIKITDANGNEEKYERNNLGLVTKFTDKNGHETSYEYNAFGKVSVITNPNGEKLLCSYDTLGYLSSVKREDGSLKKYEYDTLGRVSGLTNYNGDKTSYEYDEIGNVKKIIYPDGSNDEFSYDENSNLTEYKDRNNKVFKYEYDKDNNLTKKINPNNDEITYERNKLSQISKITDENGEISSFIYDANGNVKKKIDSKGNEECYKYNFNGEIVEITDKEGVKTSLERDYKGNITKITDGNKNVNEYYYDSASNLVKSIDGEGNTTTYKYDKNGNLIEKNSPEKIKYTYKYDSNDMLIEELVEDKTINKYEYDSNGNVSKRITGEGAEYSFEYDGEGNVTGEIDPYGDKIEYRYDSDGRIVEIIDKNGNVKTCERDNNGNIVLSSDTNGVLTKYEYDSLGNLIKQIENYNENTYKDVGKKTLDDNKKEQEKTSLNKNINRSISDTKNNSSNSYKINKLKTVNVDVKISKLSDKKLLKILGISNIKKSNNKKLKKSSEKISNKLNKYIEDKIDKQIRKNILKNNKKN